MAGFDWFLQHLPGCLACGRPFIPQLKGDYACLPCQGVRFGEPLTDEHNAVADRLLGQVFSSDTGVAPG
jgi:hypothetical protein